jgi:hypothetical protein
VRSPIVLVEEPRGSTAPAIAQLDTDAGVRADVAEVARSGTVLGAIQTVSSSTTWPTGVRRGRPPRRPIVSRTRRCTMAAFSRPRPHSSSESGAVLAGRVGPEDDSADEPSTAGEVGAIAGDRFGLVVQRE